MSADLVKRLRSRVASWIGAGMDTDTVCIEAADRIEQLERDLAEQVNKKVGYYNDWMAEKALAYDLYEEGVTSSRWDLPCYVTYRKTRGL